MKIESSLRGPWLKGLVQKQLHMQSEHDRGNPMKACIFYGYEIVWVLTIVTNRDQHSCTLSRVKIKDF